MPNLLVGVLIVSGVILLSGCPSLESENIPPPKPLSGWPFYRQCLVQAEGTVSAAKPSLTVTYSEPSTRGNGQPLNNLSHTTIYVGTGINLTKMKEVAATSPSGGGNISEVVHFPITQKQGMEVRICITATDAEGHES